MTSQHSRLWFQYMEMVAILQRFIKAERTGNWDLHLVAVREMLPFFAASGHNLYAKSAHLYLQKMDDLPKSHPDIHNSFQSGYHVVRQSNRYWAGLSTDLFIEQVLMRSLKTTGGLTQGRGMTELLRSIWLLSMPACAEINFAMQELTDVKYITSEQHIDNTKARQQRDIKDTNGILAFLIQYNPFSSDPSLHSIVSGVAAGERVDVYRAKDVGKKIIGSLIGKSVHDTTFKRKLQAVTLASKTGITSQENTFQIDPQLLFQRLLFMALDEIFQDPDALFKYELCNHPPALFDDSGLPREANKPALADEIWKLANDPQSDVPENVLHVLDGGALLQRVPWQQGMSIEATCSMYVKYVRGRYGNAHIVFDGYEGGPSIKDATHRRRAGGRVGPSVSLTSQTIIQLKKEEFLANKTNKQHFIFLLSDELEKSGCKILHAKGDADLLIVQTALESAETSDTVLIGDDTDLLVLLCYHAATEGHKVFLKQEPKQNALKRRVWDIRETKKRLGADICNNILFVHAVLGCDSTSRIHGLGKAAALKKIKDNRYFLSLAKVFDKEDGVQRMEIIEAGEKALVCLYNGKGGEGIDTLRVGHFHNKIVKSSKFVEAKTLPPTAAATRYHSTRVYYQIQEWKGKAGHLNSLEWGWVEEAGNLVPVKTDLPPAPSKLLEVVSCNCKSGCNTARCTCRKHGIECSPVCGECKGSTCVNSSRPDLDDGDSDE